MSSSPILDSVYRWFMAVDSVVSSSLFELGDGIRRGWLAYSAGLERFRITGLRRIVVDLADDAATFALVFGLGIVTFALPQVSGAGDIWNQGRQYAVTFTDVNGEIIGRRGILQDDAIPLEEVPPHVVKAVLATEDARFFQHFGVDVVGTLRAMVANAKAQDVVQGGSTLTQQLAKNLFLSPERTLRRKVHEAFLALWIEARLSKSEILKLYLDRSYLGGGTYGIEAAAQFYFGKSIRDVNLQEAAMLAGLFKAPSKYAPHVNPDNARARANVVLYRLLDVGFISQGELFEARRNPAAAVNPDSYSSPDWYLDWAYRETLELIAANGLGSDYVIEVKTAVDTEMQKAAQLTLNTMLAADAPEYKATQAALVAMQPDGAIKAIVGGRDYEESQFNRATDALRQPGSSFKPFVYLAALRSGMKPTSAITDGPVWIGNWSPQNYSHRYAGRTNLTAALAHSYNTVPVHIMKQIGRTPIVDTARLAGLKSTILPVASMPLGTNEVTVLDITTGYATFANGGRLARPHTVLEIRRPNGDLIYSRAGTVAAAEQVFPADTVADLNLMLGQVVTAGTGRRAALGYTPQAGKTGTTQSYRDAWYIGYTGTLVTGVWFGNDDYSEMRRATGGSLPALAWKRFMLQADRHKAPVAIAGLPVNETHTRYLADHRHELEGVEAPVVAVAAAAVRSDDDEVVQTDAPRQDAVVEVLQNMFTLFRTEDQVKVTRNRVSASSTAQPVRIIRQPERDSYRNRNAERLRMLLESR